MRGNKGCLFVVATPLGNLDDITLRAIDTLKGVELVAAEDTRRTRKLLSSLDIRARLVSCHEFNEAKRVEIIEEAINQGNDVALVTDAGTPGVSDPGARLIAALRERGVEIVPIPGPSAVACALSVCGMKADSYHFAGFLPNARQERKRALERLATLEELLVFFESPHRIKATLKDMLEIFGDRRAFLAREMTKAHETYISGTLSHILKELSPHEKVKGEITLVVEGSSERRGEAEVLPRELTQLLKALLSGSHLGVKEASRLIASLTGIKKGKVYELALKIKDEA